MDSEGQLGHILLAWARSHKAPEAQSMLESEISLYAFRHRVSACIGLQLPGL